MSNTSQFPGALFIHTARKPGLYLAFFTVLSYLPLFLWLYPLPRDGGTEKESKSDMRLPLLESGLSRQSSVSRMLLRQFLPQLPWGCPGTGSSENRGRARGMRFLRLLTGVPRPLLQAGLENSPQSSLPLCSHGLRDGGKHTVSSAFCSLLLFAFRRPEIPLLESRLCGI